MENTVLYRKVWGCLIGGAIGDAMGGPTECMSYDEIQRKFGKVTDLLEYPRTLGGLTPERGRYTDDK